MLAIKCVFIWMPRFFRTEFIFSMRWMIADKATKWCSLNMVGFYWLLPINWAPIWVAKPLIENFIFIWMIFQSWMSHIFINFGCTRFETFTFFQMIMSSPFSDTRLCTVFRLTPFSGLVLSNFALIWNCYLSISKWIDEDITFLIAMIGTVVHAFMIIEFTTKTFAFRTLMFTSMLVLKFALVTLFVFFLIFFY